MTRNIKRWLGTATTGPSQRSFSLTLQNMDANSFRRTQPPKRISLIIICVATVVSLTCGCSKSLEQSKSAEPEPHPVTNSTLPPLIVSARPTATPTVTPGNPSPPKTVEIDEALARVFAKAAKMDPTQAPSFVLGDFNGDGAEDIAIWARANPDSLTEINNELANWTLEDPKQVPIPGTKAALQVTRPKAISAEKGELLIAIVHGVGAQGWRNHEARQAFLLRNTGGATHQVQSARQLKEMKPSSSLPPLTGDVILETISGRQGIIFWTGAKYAWMPYQ